MRLLPTRHSCPTLVLAGLLALAGPAALSTAGPGAAADPDPRDGRRAQTSDGVRGERARDVPDWLRGTVPRAVPTEWWVAPGVRVSEWDEDSVRGPVRAQLITVKWRTPGLVVDYGNAGPVRSTATVPQILGRRSNVVGGVNGDFFDISDTGAPIGVGVERTRGLLHGRKVGWNSAFVIAGNGRPDIGRVEVVSRIRQHPDIDIATLNAPNVPEDSIGLYTPAWGKAAGTRVTGDSRRGGVRVVRIQGGRVVGKSTRLPKGAPIKGRILIGRGKGADALRALKLGSRATITSTVRGVAGPTGVRGRPRVAITGDAFLIRDGVLADLDDEILHPRTAIGIDYDTQTLLMLVVDGRQDFSRGYTMRELAEAMAELGADEALNLDGGGSSTMVARRPGSGLVTVNEPSAGFARRVANVVELRYRRPR
ncbi:phosphodiester glycosidase family protein [Nocardioides sp. GXZ039]|uniref:phosphodiester glycosidase family protein n=1 Tax=Nocardioides sp. GXZ039 TaxID=3136018 RepID=UPI0030F3795E